MYSIQTKEADHGIKALTIQITDLIGSGGSYFFNMKNMKILAIIMLSGVFSYLNCSKNPATEKVYRIWIQNNSFGIINFLVSYNFPDTIIPDQYNNIAGIKTNDRTPYDSREDWETVFKKTKLGIISVFFFSPDTITKYGWNDVRNNYRILKRKEITLQELKSHQWTVFYP